MVVQCQQSGISNQFGQGQSMDASIFNLVSILIKRPPFLIPGLFVLFNKFLVLCTLFCLIYLGMMGENKDFPPRCCTTLRHAFIEKLRLFFH